MMWQKKPMVSLYWIGSSLDQILSCLALALACSLSHEYDNATLLGTSIFSLFVGLVLFCHQAYQSLKTRRMLVCLMNNMEAIDLEIGLTPDAGTRGIIYLFRDQFSALFKPIAHWVLERILEVKQARYIQH